MQVSALSAPFWKARQQYLMRCAALLALIVGCGSLFERYCFIGLDPQNITSTGYRLYLVMREQVPTAAGQYVAFHVDHRVEPRFHAGEIFLKRIECMYPCHVEEQAERLLLNGKPHPPINPAVVSKLGRRLEDFVGQRDLGPGDLFVMGSYPRSFDSRYWGDVSSQQVIGRAYPLL